MTQEQPDVQWTGEEDLSPRSDPRPRRPTVRARLEAAALSAALLGAAVFAVTYEPTRAPTPSLVTSRSSTVLDPGRKALLEADRQRAVQSAYISRLLAYGRAASSGEANVAAARAASAKFHDLATAQRAGYGLFPDAAGLACIAQPGVGAMGLHYAKSALFADPSINVRTPEALVYAPGERGTLRLAALEYVVVAAAWEATHASPPSLFGHQFNFTPSPNRFGLPAYYSLHAWVWQRNPAGMFEMWNPNVHCPA
jgi:hypothetical protein